MQCIYSLVYCKLKLTIICLNVLQKVELRKAEIAWKRAAEVAKEQTEEEQETQVITHHNTDYSFVLLCCAILSSVNDSMSPLLVGSVSQVPGHPEQVDSSEVSETR